MGGGYIWHKRAEYKQPCMLLLCLGLSMILINFQLQ